MLKCSYASDLHLNEKIDLDPVYTRVKSRHALDFHLNEKVDIGPVYTFVKI